MHAALYPLVLVLVIVIVIEYSNFWTPSTAVRGDASMRNESSIEMKIA